jgi:hypothetical protein
VKIQWRIPKKDGPPEIYPIFIAKKSKDLMIRGGDFYAVWDDKRGVWSTDQDDVIDLIDAEIDEYQKEHVADNPALANARKLYLWNADTGMIDKWHKYVQKQLVDNFHPLNQKVVFSNTTPCREDYSSFRLPYALEQGNIDAWDEMVGTLYSPPERHKIEWLIGSVVSGDSKELQKFGVFYGDSGTGKSTILDIIAKMFNGYDCTFNAKALGSSTSEFALEPFKNNPLVAIQQDGDLSKIEDNARLNSLVSHEEIVVNEKHKSQYGSRFYAMLFMGTNKPVRITDSRSGIIRRLIDISPTGKLIQKKRYLKLKEQINFELGAIAWHCMEVYRADPYYYDDYIPQAMIGATNDFYNFMEEYLDEFLRKDYTTLKEAWTKYQIYCNEAKVPYPYSMRSFKEELKNYFREYKERYRTESGEQLRKWYGGLRRSKFGMEELVSEESDDVEVKDISDEEAAMAEGFNNWIKLEERHSLLDDILANCPAQYAVPTDTGGDRPEFKWEKCKTKLCDLDTSKLHYIRFPIDIQNHIVIDFDLKDPSTGEKSLERNLSEASKWPKTYVETSRSGKGLHLHYIYKGDVTKLSRIYDDNVEVKVFTGNSSLRRQLKLCNDIPIAEINSGLPMKEEARVVNFDGLKSEKALRTAIKRNLNKEIHADTRSSVDFIFKILNDAYESGMHYDVTDLRPAVLGFAAKSSNQSAYCIKLVTQMKFQSEDISEDTAFEDNGELVFFDVEVFPNFFGVVWMTDTSEPVKMINPSAKDIEKLCERKLVGFNNREYDNHILYARMMDYDNYGLYVLSQRIISGSKNSKFREAYNLSYTDIYDFASKKQSLKKWEIELDIHHQELGLPWDQPVPEELWGKVMDYCVNDVIATKATFHALSADFVAREILADISGLTVNHTTNQHTTKIIFGDDPNPQIQFVYTDLSKMFPGYEYNAMGIDPKRYSGKIVQGKSIYRGEDPGEGGRVYAQPGMYENVALLDIASMHPSSIENLNLFGDKYTKRFSDLKKIRILIKHGDYEGAAKLFDGKLTGYLQDKTQAKALAQALKIVINSVYGLTSASFDNKFRDPRNVDNIVAKRGALFMIELQKAVEEKGYTVAHVKTDSIKIPNADNEIIDFVMKFGEKYGYSFEHEATYEKLCLVNEAVYIAKDISDGHWTATGTQFQVPYVFKTLFSKEPIEFKDVCETKSVKTALYLDFNENLPNVEDKEDRLQKLLKKYGLTIGQVNGYLETGNASDLPNESGTALAEAAELVKDIRAGHDYRFIGRAGSFCPVINGVGGGYLMREKDGKYSFATGAKGYRWMEAEVLRTLGTEEAMRRINRKYYAALVDDAIATISEYGDFEAFAS